jgi:hypothetical protein
MRYLLANRSFTISHVALKMWAERAGVQLYWTDIKEPEELLDGTRVYSLQPFADGDDPFDNEFWSPELSIPRSCEHLVRLAELLPCDICAGNFRLVEVPDDAEVEVHQDDSGWEWLAERHRTWQ